MKQLIIKLTGEIQSSNFNEWKKDLIAQIKSIKTELTTDNDFAVATQHVKLFKSAEKSLKEAKQSAIEQAADIQKLFAAIDEVSEEARQTRLKLDRQIKVRKLEIKEELIDTGLKIISTFIDQQGADFKKIDHSKFLDRNRLNLVIKGKAGVKGVQTAIYDLCGRIKTEILLKEKEVADNGLAIDSLPAGYKLLFQDRDSLLSSTRQELASVIDKRISLFNKENARVESEKEVNGQGRSENDGLDPEVNLPTEYADIQEKEKYRIIIDIFSSKENAIEIARSIKNSHSENKLILNILLEKLPAGTIDHSEDFVSTSALSRLMELDRDAVFSILKAGGYLIKSDGQWQLTQQGIKAGGKYESVGDGPARLPVWPKNTANIGLFGNIKQRLIYSRSSRQDNKKKFVVLSKSIKYGQNCVAGREINHNESELTLGPWIRPVSDHDKGAVSTLEIMLKDGGLPHFLDIIEIEVDRNENNPIQPENWLIEKKRWKKTGRIDVDSVFKHFIERPANLWEGSFCQPDRISTDEYIRSEYNSSLCIIKPETFSMEICVIFNEFEGREQKRRRGKFLYNGVNYDLAITDPEIDRKYFRHFPGIDDGIKQITMDVEKCLLCISLTPEFNGYHYKLIATVIENE